MKMTDNFIKYMGIIHIPADKQLTICGKEYSGKVFEADILEIRKQRCCNGCFGDYEVKESKHGKPAKPDKRRSPLATW